MEAIWVATEIRAGGAYARSALPIHVFDNEAVTFEVECVADSRNPLQAGEHEPGQGFEAAVTR